MILLPKYLQGTDVEIHVHVFLQWVNPIRVPQKNQ